MARDVRIRTVCVGAKHYGAQAIELTGTLVEGEKLDLQRDHTYEPDSNAIACLCGDVRIGSIAAQAAKMIAPVMDAGTAVECVITGVPLLIGDRVAEPPHVSVNWTEP